MGSELITAYPWPLLDSEGIENGNLAYQDSMALGGTDRHRSNSGIAYCGPRSALQNYEGNIIQQVGYKYMCEPWIEYDPSALLGFSFSVHTIPCDTHTLSIENSAPPHPQY